jgi:hypothetical protein
LFLFNRVTVAMKEIIIYFLESLTLKITHFRG